MEIKDDRRELLNKEFMMNILKSLSDQVEPFKKICSIYLMKRRECLSKGVGSQTRAQLPLAWKKM